MLKRHLMIVSLLYFAFSPVSIHELYQGLIRSSPEKTGVGIVRHELLDVPQLTDLPDEEVVGADTVEVDRPDLEARVARRRAWPLSVPVSFTRSGPSILPPWMTTREETTPSTSPWPA